MKNLKKFFGDPKKAFYLFCKFFLVVMCLGVVVAIISLFKVVSEQEIIKSLLALVVLFVVTVGAMAAAVGVRVFQKEQ